MISLTPKSSRKKKNSEIIEVPSWLPSSPDRKPLDYAIWRVLENQINATSHPNIGSLKSATEKEWNKMSEEFILKAYKSFRRRVVSIVRKIAAILN